MKKALKVFKTISPGVGEFVKIGLTEFDDTNKTATDYKKLQVYKKEI